jgi:hypothetical protein
VTAGIQVPVRSPEFIAKLSMYVNIQDGVAAIPIKMVAFRAIMGRGRHASGPHTCSILGRKQWKFGGDGKDCQLSVG